MKITTSRVDVAPMRETARSTLSADKERLDDYDELRGCVQQLVPQVRALIARLPTDDAPARVAQIGVDEAWRRLHTPRGFGPDAALRQVQRLARSVLSLCDHYENLAPAADGRSS
ncbi:DUF6415 family natural product biosynthesis protein [Streptomyces sp. NPDC007861]|uniref:DUF6415 family natural product biosynthesis protein n=1 Tax=Streptomyces sp. NPDC007861 TaxID=3154893 RepID=UPI0033D0D7C5